MAITIGTNIASLGAQRRLAEGSSALSAVYERLSSGQRINKASDDAAGLAIASSLNADIRVYSQGVRNLNDGVSALNIADGAVDQLTQIVTRIKELAEQSANGTLANKQRGALDAEAQALSKEYFRIVKTTQFNNQNLLDGTNGNMTLQAGYGTSAVLGASTGGVMGTGSFGTAANYVTDWDPYSVALGDLNSDGNLDVVTANEGDDTATVLLGNGDGTFKGRTNFVTGSYPVWVAIGDLNSDGVLDIVTADMVGGHASVLLGNGDGTFKAKADFVTGLAPSSLALGDVNGDGVLDIVSGNDGVSVLLGNGDGTFKAKADFETGSGLYPIALGDVNGDGVLDIVSCIQSSDTASVLLGNGNGTFKARTNFGTGSTPWSVSVGDVNGDGKLDIVSANWTAGTASVLIGNGNGTFKAKADFATGSNPEYIAFGDLNGDGVSDIISANNGAATASVLIGNGDGTFKTKTDFGVGLGPRSVALGDLNSDGVVDMVTANANTVTASILLAQTRTGVSPLLPFSLKTQADAKWALSLMSQKLPQLDAQRGIIGSNQSRINVAINVLQASAENFAAAESRIRDADIAEESARLTRLQIVQQATASVLAQANLQPALATKLLNG